MTSRQLVLVVFEIEGHQIAVHLSAVDRVVYAVEITELPKAPAIVMGVINVNGRVVPVFNVRKRFGFPAREMTTTDQFILAHTSHREVALVVDHVRGVIECPAEDMEASSEILPGLEYVEGVVKRDDGLIVIHNLEEFLSIEEEELLGRLVKA